MGGCAQGRPEQGALIHLPQDRFLTRTRTHRGPKGNLSRSVYALKQAGGGRTRGGQRRGGDRQARSGGAPRRRWLGRGTGGVAGTGEVSRVSRARAGHRGPVQAGGQPGRDPGLLGPGRLEEQYPPKGSSHHWSAWPSHSGLPTAVLCTHWPGTALSGLKFPGARSSLRAQLGSRQGGRVLAGAGSLKAIGFTVSEDLTGSPPCHGPDGERAAQSKAGAVARRPPCLSFPSCAGPGSYPARSFSFLSVMPSLDTSLLNTRIPMAMFTCQAEGRVCHVTPLPRPLDTRREPG